MLQATLEYLCWLGAENILKWQHFFEMSSFVFNLLLEIYKFSIGPFLAQVCMFPYAVIPPIQRQLKRL